MGSIPYGSTGPDRPEKIFPNRGRIIPRRRNSSWERWKCLGAGGAIACAAMAAFWMSKTAFVAVQAVSLALFAVGHWKDR